MTATSGRAASATAIFHGAKAEASRPPLTGEHLHAEDARHRPSGDGGWLDRHLEQAARRGGSLQKTCTYLHNQWDKLTGFVADQRLYPDNDRAERHMRPVALGRRNWLFAKSTDGAEAAAAWYSVIETAKANGLEPYHYLRWVLTELPRHAGTQPDNWEAFFPWNLTPDQIGQPGSRRG